MNETDKAVDKCQSDADGECNWDQCPQLRDAEPETTGRSCPMYDWHNEDRRF